MGMMDIFNKVKEIGKAAGGSTKDKAKAALNMAKGAFKAALAPLKLIIAKYVVIAIVVITIVALIIALVVEGPRLMYEYITEPIFNFFRNLFGLNEDAEILPSALVELDGSLVKYNVEEEVLKELVDSTSNTIDEEHMKEFMRIHVNSTYPDIGNAKYEGKVKVVRSGTELTYQPGATTANIGHDNFSIIQASAKEQYVKKLVWNEAIPYYEMEDVLVEETDEEGNIVYEEDGKTPKMVPKKDENGNVIQQYKKDKDGNLIIAGYNYTAHEQELDSTSNAYSMPVYFFILLNYTTEDVRESNLVFMEEVAEMIDKDIEIKLGVGSTMGYIGDNWTNNLKEILQKEEYEDIKNALIIKGDAFLEAISESKELKGLYSRILSMMKSLGYNGKYAKLYSNGENFSVTEPTLSKELFIQALNNYDGGGNFIECFRNNAADIYDWSVLEGINPEFVITKAQAESGYKKPSPNNYNFWGLFTPNGQAVAQIDSVQQGVTEFCRQIQHKTDPTHSAYQDCATRMEWYQTGISPPGMGTNAWGRPKLGSDGLPGYEGGIGEPGSLEWVMCMYTWIGDHVVSEDSGVGGTHALRIIFDCQTGDFSDEYMEHCGFTTAAEGEHHHEFDPPTAYEQSKYTWWNCDQQRKIWKSIFGPYAPVAENDNVPTEFPTETSATDENVKKLLNHIYSYIGKTYTDMGSPGIEWCAWFISKMLQQTGFYYNVTNNTDGTFTNVLGYYKPAAANAGRLREQGAYPNYEPKPGDIIFYNNTKRDYGHIGIVYECKKSENGQLIVYAIGGNEMSNDFRTSKVGARAFNGQWGSNGNLRIIAYYDSPLTAYS